ncbi:MAG: LLM class flavin-dependent oxidoreductase [Aquimonas sp.]|nr:LLM class flavin-dependent oxidoreductase [Aquimonas sp.]
MPPETRSVMRCVLLGEQSLALECGERLRARGHAVVALVSPTMRLRTWAADHGIPSYARLEDLLAAAPECELLLAVTWMQMLPAQAIALPRQHAIGFHDGPLPRYAGLNAPVWALLNGESEHGVSWLRLAARADAGELLMQEHFPIPPGSSAVGLNTDCFESAKRSFERLLDQLESGQLQPLQQVLSDRSFYAADKRPSRAALLDFQQPAAALERVVAALDYGPYPNPLMLPRLRLRGRDLLVREARALPGNAGTTPGEVLAVDAEGLQLACAEGALLITRLALPCGSDLPPALLTELDDLQPGQRLPGLEALDVTELDAAVRRAAASEAYWLAQLRQCTPWPPPWARAPGTSGARLRQPLLLRGLEGCAALLAALARMAGIDALSLGLTPRTLTPAAAERVVEPRLPLSLGPDWTRPLSTLCAQLKDELDRADTSGGLLSDLRARQPDGRSLMAIAELPLQLLRGAHAVIDCTAPLALRWQDDDSLLLEADADRFDSAALARLCAAAEALAAAAANAPEAALASLPLIDVATRAALLQAACGSPLPEGLSEAAYAPRHDLAGLFEAQVAARPQAEALVFEGQRLSYAELDARVADLAARLAGAGVAAGDRVGVLLHRSPILVAALLAIHRLGAAYVPLDPLYPTERLRYMAADAELRCVLSEAATAGLLDAAGQLRIDLDGARAEPPPRPSGTDPLAYLIYTSGSTGRPKGVMVAQSNALRFFAGMDEVLGTEPGTWLAVTSISFDISVLELLWTLARGYRVVLYADRRRQQAAGSEGIGFGLFFWNVASEAELEQGDKYRLLLDAARFADRNGFNAVWTPERHFAAFGGLYPNPAVTSAALATITERVALRAGSCVVPLHHPIRIAEEWAVVDNLSNGRVGLSIAPGWAAPDFALRPENHARAKQVMFEAAEQVQRLWRGETVSFPGPQGEVAVRTLPRPVQKELPLWVTTAGNPETFADAGRMGANVLTHLLGQNIDEVATKIAAYRRARAEAGHSGRGIVTLMLHTFIGDSREQVEAIVRGPMKAYLRSAMALVKAAAWHFPTFKRLSEAQGRTLDAFFDEASSEDMDALLEFAFQRYFGDSGLFGAPEEALEMVRRVADIDVDEIGCLIDFGVDTATVLAHLPQLDRLRRLSESEGLAPLGARADHSLPALLERESPSHLQCTPSMAAMLVEDPASARLLGRLQHLLLGGEALPPALAQRIAALGVARTTNVYGPTETTVWSAADRVESAAGAHTTPIGRALAGQRLYVLDRCGQLLPPGLAGELVIGGGGVTPGYWRQPELSAERFLPDPWAKHEGARMYRTGDLGRLREDGRFECLGRVDQQVKIRGYRVELGEIEARLAELPGIHEAAVLLREDSPGDQRLIGYVRAPGLDEAALAERLLQVAGLLPEFMRPSRLITLAELPRTPNGKLDRKALPAPARPAASTDSTDAAHTSSAQPQSEAERVVAELWAQALGVPEVGTRDNFFDIGGHSLLVVQLLRELRERFDRPLQMTDLFRYTTVESLARFLAAEAPAESTADRSRARAQSRAAMLARRRGAT